MNNRSAPGAGPRLLERPLVLYLLKMPMLSLGMWLLRTLVETLIKRLVPSLALCLLLFLTPPVLAETASDPVADHSLQPHYLQPPPGPAIGADRLDDILRELALPETGSFELWERLQRWLEETFGGGESLDLPDWLEDFRVSDDTVLYIFYGACALVVLLSLAIIGNELRIVRWRKRQQTAAPAMVPDAAASPLSDPDQLPLHELPAFFLKQILARLASDPAFPRRRSASLTHREIERAAAALAPVLAEPIVATADVAERIRYAATAPETAEIERAVAGSRAVLSSLERNSGGRA